MLHTGDQRRTDARAADRRLGFAVAGPPIVGGDGHQRHIEAAQAAEIGDVLSFGGDGTVEPDGVNIADDHWEIYLVDMRGMVDDKTLCSRSPMRCVVRSENKQEWSIFPQSCVCRQSGRDTAAPSSSLLSPEEGVSW